MQINGYELALSEEQLDTIINEQTIPVELITKDFVGYRNLSDGDKKALQHLVNAGRIMNDVSQEQDHRLNRELKKGLKLAAEHSSHAAKALQLFTFMNGVEGSNGIDAKPIEIFKNVTGFNGRNFYPDDLEVEEFHQIIKKMLEKGKTDEVRRILSVRSMVRRNGDELKAIDYTEYFAKEFSEIAKELELAAHYTTDSALKEYLIWQVQALLKNDEQLDMQADKHWANLQDTDLEFTISRENYDDSLSGTICENKELSSMLAEHNIEVNAKDMLGIRVGIVNKEGTKLLLTFKEGMKNLAKLMPYSEQYTQNITKGDELNQTMVDVDLAALCGDFAQCRGHITTAENLPNNDKLSVKMGGGRRNVYHRQVRMSRDKKRDIALLNALVRQDFHQYFNPEAEHIFVIGHENGHSLGPDSGYQNALGLYKHTIEEDKADIVSITFMPEYVKSGIISEQTLKEVYTTWITRLLLKAKSEEPHRLGDLINFNFLHQHQALEFDADRKLVINFAKLPEVVHKLLSQIIAVQLSKSPEQAKSFIDNYSTWGEIHEYIASTQKQLGIKPYKNIRMYF